MSSRCHLQNWGSSMSRCLSTNKRNGSKNSSIPVPPHPSSANYNYPSFHLPSKCKQALKSTLNSYSPVFTFKVSDNYVERLISIKWKSDLWYQTRIKLIFFPLVHIPEESISRVFPWGRTYTSRSSKHSLFQGNLVSQILWSLLEFQAALDIKKKNPVLQHQWSKAV